MSSLLLFINMSQSRVAAECYSCTENVYTELMLPHPNEVDVYSDNSQGQHSTYMHMIMMEIITLTMECVHTMV